MNVVVWCRRRFCLLVGIGGFALGTGTVSESANGLSLDQTSRPTVCGSLEACPPAEDSPLSDEEELAEDGSDEELLSDIVPSEIPAATKEVIAEIDKEIQETDAELDIPEKPVTRIVAAIPFEINQNVRKWLHYFSKVDHERFQRFLDRGEAYRGLVKRLLKENHVPPELYYLAMIESGYVIQARSHASAVGPWQFIRGTAERYGLLYGRGIDERRDIIRATQSAARYLRGLHLVFQDWYLAMAAYNAGEGRIVGAMLRGETRDFWRLVELKALPEETRDYVPKFLAAAIIGRHPERYGFVRNPVEVFPEVEGATVPGGVALARVAERSGVPVSLLHRMNPHLLRATTPYGLREYQIWVPAGSATRVAAVVSTLERMREEPRIASATGKGKRYHTVRAGENLTVIAKRYGLTASALKRINGLRSNRIAAGKRLLVVQGPRSTAAAR